MMSPDTRTIKAALYAVTTAIFATIGVGCASFDEFVERSGCKASRAAHYLVSNAADADRAARVAYLTDFATADDAYNAVTDVAKLTERSYNIVWNDREALRLADPPYAEIMDATLEANGAAVEALQATLDASSSDRDAVLINRAESALSATVRATGEALKAARAARVVYAHPGCP